MIKIKVCGLRNPENITEIASSSPDYMGFIFYPESVRYIGRNPDKHIFSQVPRTIKKTGVFVDEKIVKVREIAKEYRLDAVQLHGSESPDYCSYFRSSGLITIKTFWIGQGFDFDIAAPYLDSCDYFLFDTFSPVPGGSGKKFRWKILEDYMFEKPFFLSGGISDEDIETISVICHKMLYAVDINSRFETEPGVKNAVLVGSFIEKIKNIGYEIQCQ